jgi:small subunit ribosomal protein S1
VLIDIGFKSEGIVSGRELERVVDYFDTLEIGDEIPVYVMREDKDGAVQLSISRALAEKDWDTAEELMASQAMFDAQVESFNRGGVIIKLVRCVALCPPANW